MIHSVTNPEQWRHVPAETNPGGHVTRGLTASQLAQSDVWWTGPSFLKKSETEWPEKHIEHDVLSDKEVKKSDRTSIETDKKETALLSTIVPSTFYLKLKLFSLEFL